MQDRAVSSSGENPGLPLKSSRKPTASEPSNSGAKEEGGEEKSVATGVRMKVHVFFLRRNTLLPLVPPAVMEEARPPPKN